MDKNISDIIRKRIEESGKKYFCNSNISEFIYNEEELNSLLKEVEEKIKDVLKSLVIDFENDHNTSETAKRVSKMFINEIFKGRYHKKPQITDFPNFLRYDELYITGPITIRSTCAHHWMPIVGKCFIGVFPGKKVIGLSKFNRIVDWICSRPQIQEEMTVQIADEIEKCTEAEGIAVIVGAEHMCLTHRGCKEHRNNMVTSVMRGKFREDPNLKNEFLSLVGKNFK